MDETRRMVGNANSAASSDLEHSASCPDFLPNSSADNSLKRGKDRLEKTADLHKAAARRAAEAAAGGTVFPLLPLSRPKKKTNVLGEVQLHLQQLGVKRAPAEDLALPRLSSAPMPLIAPQCPAPGVQDGASDAPSALRVMGSRRVRGRSSSSSPRRSYQARSAGSSEEQSTGRPQGRTGLPQRRAGLPSRFKE